MFINHKVNSIVWVKNTVLNLLLVSITLFFSSSVFSQETLIFNTVFTSPISKTDQTGFADRVLAEAFKRVGYKLETVQLPGERAIFNANRGLADGDLLRISGLEKKYPNLIKVPEKVMDLDMVLFTKNKRDFKVKGWSSLTTESITIIRGTKVFEKKLPKTVELISTDSMSQRFTMLAKDRVDFSGGERWTGLEYIKNHNLKNVILLEPPLMKVALYTYLHKKHAKLVPKLAAAIKSMKKDGTIKKLYNNLLTPLMKK